MDKKAILKIMISSLIILLVAYFFGKQVYHSIDGLKGFEWNLSIAYVLLALLFFILHLALSVVQYWLALREMGYYPNIKSVAKARTIADLCAYVPGKVLTLLARIKYLKHELRISGIAASTAVEAVMMVVSASILFLLALLWGKNMLGSYAYLVYIAVPLCIIAIHPKIMSFLLNLFLKIIGKEPVNIELSLKSIVKLTAFYVFPWILIGIAVFFVISSIYALSFGMVPEITLAYAIAWVVGFLAFFVPSGLGVREGVLGYALSFLMPSHIAIISALISRLLLMAAQLIVGWIARKL